MRVIFSYDCEGNWGFVDKGEAFDSGQAERLRDSYDAILSFHERSCIPATFAFVGMFAAEPEVRRGFLDGELADLKVRYPYIDRFGGCWEGSHLFELVRESEFAIPASHSMTHIPIPFLSESEARAEMELSRRVISRDGASGPLGFVFPRNLFAYEHLASELFAGVRPTPANSRFVVGYEYLRAVSGIEFRQNVTSDFAYWNGGARARFSDAAWRRLWERRLASIDRWEERTIHVWSHPHNALTDSSYFERLAWLLEALKRERGHIDFAGLIP